MLIVTVNIIAMCMESFGGMYGTNRTAYSLSIVFYYLFFCVESFKCDPLTKALNRHCFYIDSEKHKEEIFKLPEHSKINFNIVMEVK